MALKLFDFYKIKIFKDREFLIHRITSTEEKSFTYGEVVASAKEFIDFLSKIDVKKTRISLQCHHCPELCIVLLSILNCDCSFCPIPHDATCQEAMDTARIFCSPFFISCTCLWENNRTAKLVGTTSILNTVFYIYRLIDVQKKFRGDKLLNECYCIKTSGSTGNPKVVRVPYPCIAPNIKGLSNILKLSFDDIIFMSSPITFDPFIVEYFLALWNGAALLITNLSIRTDPCKLMNVLQPQKLRGVTVVQTTPSLFRLFGLRNIQQTILCKTTTIRILLLGGERFPSIKEIANWTTENHCNTRIFNIYGITEVSCWSTLHEVKLTRAEKYISIGFPIDSETHVRLVNDMNEPLYEGFGEIQIGSSSRKCIIDDEAQADIFSIDILYRSTGDIGYISKGRIFYDSRKSSMIKRYGHRVHLGRIMKTVLQIDGVLNTCCVFDDLQMKLICFILKNVKKRKTEIRRSILFQLKNFEKPDDIHFVDRFPVTPHGKISETELLRTYKNSTNNTAIETFEKFITNVLCLDYSYTSAKYDRPKQNKMSLDISFLNAGGTSFQALTLSTQIEHVLQRPDSNLLEMLLNGTTSISSILEYISKINPAPLRVQTPKRFNIMSAKELLKLKWQYDTGKCVDATPSCYGGVVCVGSHSHLLATLDLKTGREISTCILPDRIECQVSFVDDRLISVGCYDGNLYLVDYLCGKINWKFDCGGMIKAKALQNGNLAVIGNYSTTGNLLCLNLKEKQTVWRIQIGSKGIFATPLQINNESLLACTLCGKIVCVIFYSGRITWKKKCLSPIFSSPSMLTEDTAVVAEVNGTVHCLDVKSGTEIWCLQTDGNIFSNMIVHNVAETMFIIFGNHDYNVYCLKSTQTTYNTSINWKSELDSAVYSTPAILQMSTDNFAVLSCTTKGGIYILDFLTGSRLFTLNIGNEIFSSPSIMENRIYIGCRNNNLICLELQIEK